ncbi:hypothetical protein DRF65_14130 [Chryseobacterium pennae]|uniref:Uncharacterized protein n=1 Tax=Chryseobacterium pennae TaxID=2258962 RepID=A0A3D9C8F6_9FLAO|nr:hypothetical protein [Chryseobacterium pennae]REC61866.1 hypothetical protein DRF65_14130 [Chryseobacterium pennae]
MNTNQIETMTEFSFHFSVVGQLSEFVKLQLFDGYGQMVAENYERIDLILPKGLYQLYIFSNETFEKEYIVLDRNYEGNWNNRGSYSSIPNSFLESSHSYYTDAVEKWSKKTTMDRLPILREDTSLFIFFRYPSKEAREGQTKGSETMSWRFSILDSNRKKIYQFNEDNAKEDRNTGWLAFNATLPHGIYYLVYRGHKNTTREIPLQVFAHWQTQFFLTFKKTPIFSTARIQIVQPLADDIITQEDNLQLDALLRNMQNGNYFVPKNIIDKTAFDKWYNPMLAIAVCYAYLLSPQETDNNLFRNIIRNLEQKILNYSDSSDIKIIKLLAAIHFNEEIPVLDIDTPCMVNAGIKTLIEQNIRFPERIRISGLCELILPDLNSDMVWTSYTPPNYNVFEHKNVFKISDTLLLDFSNFPDVLIPEVDTLGEPLIVYAKNEIPTDWVTQSIMSQLSAKSSKPYTSAELAKQFQVSTFYVEKSLRNIQKVISNNFLIDIMQEKGDFSQEEIIMLKDNMQKII